MRKFEGSIVFGLMLMATPALAEDDPNWQPPQTPELHERSDLDYKSPYSGPFLGAGLTFGQANPAGGSAGLAYAGQAEFGYAAGFQNFSKFETSLELFYGGANFRLDGENGGSAKLADMVGAMAKIGYGKSLNKGFFSLWKAGIGGAVSEYSTKLDGVTFDSKDDVSGFMAQVGWSLTKRITDSVEVEGAFELTHAQFNLGTVEGTVAGEAVETDVDRNAILNIPSLSLGLRFFL